MNVFEAECFWDTGGGNCLDESDTNRRRQFSHPCHFFFFSSSPFFQILFCIFNWTSVKSLSKKPINYPSKFSPCLTVANDLCVTSG